jgi:S-adenosylmethionine:tRNA ribosyltransferase-isomerase
MDEFDYELPEDLIAQVPLADRSGSRLMVLDRAHETIEHHQFVELPDLLRSGDLLVRNDSRVIPARLAGTRATGGSAEFLLLREVSPRCWLVLMRPARRLRIGDDVVFHSRTLGAFHDAVATVREKGDDGQGVVELDETLAGHLERYGSMPLPPYIHTRLEDDERYQTVYARHTGSAAAPTAGLHFTDGIFERLAARGIRTAQVTLHVGLDTFRPVTAEYAEDHVIHKEWFDVPAETAHLIAETRGAGGRVIAIGTTAARTLESFGQLERSEPGAPASGMTGIYITPGYEWTTVDAMVTNFHLPKSTLLLMLSAFAGREFILRAYAEAVRERYRFFSFGDAMLVQ